MRGQQRKKYLEAGDEIKRTCGRVDCTDTNRYAVISMDNDYQAITKRKLTVRHQGCWISKMEVFRLMKPTAMGLDGYPHGSCA